jgi:isopenicillin N synthase-like dioxygenase
VNDQVPSAVSHPFSEGGVPVADGVPVIDVGPLVAAAAGSGGGSAELAAVAQAIDAACHEVGFFYVVGHGVDEALPARLDSLAREFFALDESEKSRIAMPLAGQAWRGWFPLGGELTSGVPDRKEGLYFGSELGPDHPRVRDGVPLHGANLFPARPGDLGPTVLAYVDALTTLGHVLMSGIGLALGLDACWFATHLTADPTILFRIFQYPASPEDDDDGRWGVAEHTDYGLLTILRQDDVGGLEVHSRSGWIEAPPVPGSFVCNLGDMLERMTGGAYVSTPHRVRNRSAVDRISQAFFFDPSWDAEIRPVPVAPSAQSPSRPRWDQADVHTFQGTYGDYLLTKVQKVFPHL